MSDLKPRLSADRSLYDAADAALRNLCLDLIQRAQVSGDNRMVVDFGERLLRYGCTSIAKASSLPKAAEHAYRAADDLVAASLKGAGR
ncbi:hypothetical protein [Methylobacterium sp. Leaf88]|uniref:hypothetical protein n=1 Tax=Methylobacterium sp. Leaf88 TaxID=1736244 RepID=UPI0006F5F53E|nr:hypothetical protein [Methylobacterium sp. Leaf88]KQO76447.1 hypothetical protein ASF20_13965 [Methylobacterium sp. Leaf88]